MGCHACVEGVDAFQSLRGKGEVGADSAFEARQEEGSSYVGEESDGGFRHGEQSPFGCDPYGCMDGEAHTAAHGDAIHVGDVGFWVCRYQVVKLVF